MTAPDPEFLEIFRDEAGGRLDHVVDTLLALENGSAAADAVDSLFRDVHTIKGAAGMVGLADVSALAHVMEDLLADARHRGALATEHIDPLLRASDALRRHVAGEGEPNAGLIAELAAVQAPGNGTTAEPHQPVAPAAAPAPAAESRSIRVPAEKIDTLLDLVGETVLHRRRLEHELGANGHAGHGIVTDELDRGERLLDGLKGAAIGMRTLPLSSIVTPLPRAVRDLATETGKQVELFVVGAETELDRAILEGLSEPLVHLLRNAIGHGIESPEERERAGKPARGRLELRAEQRGSIVEVTVADDGRGISEGTLAEARRTGSLTAVLTQPGFSTAGGVSAISGRGVGLDAVKEQAEAFGGSIEVRSEPGLGMDVILRLPLALALIEVLLVERAGNVYGFPLTSVEEAVSLGETLSLGGRPAIDLRGRSIALADLAELMGAAAAAQVPRAPVVVLTASGQRVALVCDALLGKEEVVVKSLGPLLAALPSYLGAAILGDGRIALLVDPAVLVRAAAPPRAAAAAPSNGNAPAPSNGHAPAPKVLVVEDSLTIRELQRSILEAAGYRVQTARDGRDALAYIGGDNGIDIVVTDVEMPEMTGIELTESIRAHATCSALPVVIVTSLGDDEHRQRGIDAGADAYMVKQRFDQHDLLETVERLVGR
ncbi:MAG: response regulator [Solirubrobacteraceae bacterium]